MSLRANLLILIAILMPLLCWAQTTRPAENSRTILFIDDHDILYRSGTRRVLNPATRHPANPLIAPDKPWEVQLAVNSVHRDPHTGRYQLWYQAWNDAARQRTHDCVVAYAESDDGIRFTRPQLEIHPFNDVTRTNIVLIGNGGHSYRYSNSVLVEPDEKDAGRRYKMAYFDWAKDDDGREYPGLCVAFSPDGVHWTKHPKAPLQRIAYVNYEEPLPFADEATTRPWAVPMSMADAVDVMFDPVRHVYAWYGKMWLDGPAGGMAWKHAMGRSESADFIHWSKPQLVCTPDDLDAAGVEFHTSPVFFYSDVYFCLNQILDRATDGGVINIELMTSRDGLKWERNFRNRWFIARAAQPGRFDSGSVFTNSTPVVLPDEIRFYYGGYRAGATGADDLSGVSGIGLATLPRDRFAGIQPVARSDQPTLRTPLQDIGQVTLKPLELGRFSQLTLNADASAGSIRVEVLDDSGRRVRGFSADDAKPISGDSLRHAVRWTKGRISELPQGKYLLRLHLHNATVFALSLSE